jgi:hypothetical protein
MFSISRRFAASVAIIGIALSLVACGDDEATQRKAFIEFLQTRIINKPGLHVPQLNDELARSFGPYAKHYAVITSFGADMDQSVAGLPKAMRQMQVGSVGDVMNKRADIAAARDWIANFRVALNEKLATAETARAGLTQPEDLKIVYDSAFDRTVRSPANAFNTALPLAEGAAQSVLALIDYVNIHRDQVAVQGANISVNDPKVRAQVSALLDDINRKHQQIQEVQSQVNKMMTGY